MYQKFYLLFVLIVVTIAGNGMAKFLLVDVPEEKGIIEKGDGKWKFNQKVINNKLDASLMIHIFLILANDSNGYFRFKICLYMIWAPGADAVIKENKDVQKEGCVAHVVLV